MALASRIALRVIARTELESAPQLKSVAFEAGELVSWE
jgi:hypothetical protein